MACQRLRGRDDVETVGDKEELAAGGGTENPDSIVNRPLQQLLRRAAGTGGAVGGFVGGLLGVLLGCLLHLCR